MGKTYRHVFAGSNSVSYHSSHDRGFAKQKKQYSHKQNRKKNKNCDEQTFQKNNWFSSGMHMNSHWASQYIGKNGNVPNFQGYSIHEQLYKKSKWKKNHSSHLETIHEAIIESDNSKTVQYLIATRKQIERRGKAGFFTGHSRHPMNQPIDVE